MKFWAIYSPAYCLNPIQLDLLRLLMHVIMDKTHRLTDLDLSGYQCLNSI